jgi:hypothetical protein
MGNRDIGRIPACEQVPGDLRLAETECGQSWTIIHRPSDRLSLREELIKAVLLPALHSGRE